MKFITYLHLKVQTTLQSKSQWSLNLQLECLNLKNTQNSSRLKYSKRWWITLFLLGVGENTDVSDLEQTKVSPVEPITVLSQQTNVEAPSKDILLAEQPVWEVEMVVGGQQCPTATSFSPAPSEEEAEDLSRSRDEGEEEFEAGTVTAPITNKAAKNDEEHVMSQRLSSSQTPIPEQSELFDPQSLHIPEQQNTVEGSQVGGATAPGTALFFKLNLFYLFPSWLSSLVPAMKHWHQRVSILTWVAQIWRRSPALSSGASPPARFACLTQKDQLKMKTALQVGDIENLHCMFFAESLKNLKCLEFFRSLSIGIITEAGTLPLLPTSHLSEC